MAKTDFLGIMVRNVSYKFARLGETYKFNTVKKQSELCAPTVNGAAFSVTFNLTAADAKVLYEQCKTHYESCNVGKPFFSVFGMKKQDDGTVDFTAKRGGTNQKGEVNKKPTVINGMKQAMEDVNFWGGSTGNIKVTAKPSTDPKTGNEGISLLIDTVQVVHAVYGGNNLDDFDEFTDGTSSGGGQPKELDDFASVADPFADVAPKANNANLDDEIPF